MTDIEFNLRTRIRKRIFLFMLLLILSGLTAFPIATELELSRGIIARLPYFLRSWLSFVSQGTEAAYPSYPFLAYGTDWLAFAHIVIAISFIGPLRDPVRNIWVIESGMISCLLVLPLALICGPIRGIPFFWQLIDCSFGCVGFLFLYPVHKMIKKLSSLTINT